MCNFRNNIVRDKNSKKYLRKLMTRSVFLLVALILIIIGNSLKTSYVMAHKPLLPQAQTGECVGDGIYIYEDSNYQGVCRKFTGDVSDFRNIEFDNMASSIRFVGTYSPWSYRVTLCDYPNYGGECSPFFIGDNPNFNSTRIGHDHASSLRLEFTDYSESIRIGTYNVQFLPTEFEDEGCCEDIPGRIDKLAERIIAAEYDIIILNEAFTDDIQEGLRDRLQEYYPHLIRKLDGDNGIFPDVDQDSGLMLFSRFPFLPIDANPYPADVVYGANGTRDHLDVAFRVFQDDPFGCYGDLIDGSGYDCLANKGGALVRVWNPLVDRVYNVVFTHLDAGSSHEDERARGVNFWIIQDIIEDTLTEEQINTEDIFLLGDLNLDGEDRTIESEWEFRFNTEGSFFTDKLQDIWAHQRQKNLPQNLGSYRDSGHTSDVPKLFDDSGKKRLDYILHNNPDSPTFNDELCVQHMSIAYNLRHGAPYAEGIFADAGFQDLSDHYGVNADINKKAPYCSSGIARENLPLDTFLEGTITFPGSMQWYRIDPDRINSRNVNGTYSIQVDSQGPVDFQVFKSSNLSAPLPRQSGVAAANGWVYHMNNEPFYIRIFSEDRTWTGDYEIIIHKHKGTSKEDAIILLPNEAFDVNFSPNETKWFEINTEAPDSGQAQSLSFGSFSGLSPAGVVELRAADGLTSLTGPVDNTIYRNDVADNNTRIYMLVTNDQPEDKNQVVMWLTDLTVFYGSLEQPLMFESVGHTYVDDIRIFSEQMLLVETGPLGLFDNRQIRGLGDVMRPIRFLGDAEVNNGVGTIASLSFLEAQDYHSVSLSVRGIVFSKLKGTRRHGLQSAIPRDAPLVPNKLQVDATPIAFSIPLGLISKTLTIDNQNPLSRIPWNAEANQPWVKLSSSSGDTPNDLTVTIDEFNMPGGTHTATLTISSPNALEPVQISIEVTAPYRVLLPVVFKDFIDAPDLIIESVDAGSNSIQVVIKNQGSAPVNDAFWVDVYFDPNQTPTVNKPWKTIADYGATWGVTQSLAPGESLTLVSEGNYYFDPPESSVPPFPVGAQVYVLVDSVNHNTSYGNVQESNENNNLIGPVESTATVGSVAVMEITATPSLADLPAR